MYARYIPPATSQQRLITPPRTSIPPKHEREQSSKRKRSDKANANPVKRRRHSGDTEHIQENEETLEAVHGKAKAKAKSRTQRSSKPDDAATHVDAAIAGTHDADIDTGPIGHRATNGEIAYVAEREQRKAERKAARRAARASSPTGRDGERPSKAHARILQKFEKSAQRPEDRDSSDESATPEQEPELRDLVPIPRPKAAAGAFAKPSFSALPPWLSEPIVIPPGQQLAFEDLGIDSGLLAKLEAEGFNAALPVQAGVLPLLLPAPSQHPGDVCVSAATGSGKTIAYVLPIIQSLRRRVETRLRALLVVPTRELVSQVRQVADNFAKGTDLKIGTAVGSHTLKAEQESLVLRGNQFDPNGWEELRMFLHAPANDSSHWDDPDHDARVEEALATLPSHVPDYRSKVDILICTPGRLVDHIKHTRGFSLGDLEWLVIDEADRLLDQSFQEWSDIVNQALSQSRTQGQIRPWRTNYPAYGVGSCRDPSFQRGVRKVMLSATMTNDLSQLDALKLQNPKLVVIGSPLDGDGDGGGAQAKASIGATTLPPTLEEHAVPVGDGSDKPLYVMQLLDSVFGRVSEFSEKGVLSMTKHEAKAGSEYDSSEDEGDDSDASSSVVSSDSSSVLSSSSSVSSVDDASSVVSGASSASTSSTASSSTSDSADMETSTPSIRKELSKTGLEDSVRNALIFTSTNEAALRLSSLLGLLSAIGPKPYRIATITKSSNTSSTRSTLQAFNNGNVDVLVASDRIARGLDLPRLSTVINYGVPRSMTSYVHRAGRTARAGRRGTVWTLLEKHEARWFWREVGGADAAIERPNGGLVHRTRLPGQDGWSQLAIDKYSEALAQLKKDVTG